MRQHRRPLGALILALALVATIAGCGINTRGSSAAGDKQVDMQNARARGDLGEGPVFLHTRGGQLQAGLDGSWYIAKLAVLRINAKREPDDAVLTVDHDTVHLELPTQFRIPGFAAIDPAGIDPMNSQLWPLFVPVPKQQLGNFLKVQVVPAHGHTLSEYVYHHTMAQLSNGQHGFFDPMQLWRFRDTGQYALHEDTIYGDSRTPNGTATVAKRGERIKVCVPSRDRDLIRTDRHKASGGLIPDVTFKPTC